MGREGGREEGREGKGEMNRQKKHVSTRYLHVHPHAQTGIVPYKQTHMHKNKLQQGRARARCIALRQTYTKWYAVFTV